jgi:hypothetical protein
VFLAGQAVSLLGDGLAVLAIPLLVLGLVVAAGGAGGLLGAVSAPRWPGGSARSG